MNFVALPFDSELFGYPVGRVEMAAETSAPYPAEVKARSPFRLTYLFSPIELSHWGNYLVDIKQTYGREVAQIEKITVPVVAFDGANTSKLFELGLASGQFSRFATDPHFKNNEFEKLYEIWMERSLSGELADRILTAKIDGRVAGMVTVRFLPNHMAKIGLIAVDEHFRGKGVGRSLVLAAYQAGFENGARVLEVDTQGQNEPACALYKACNMALLRTVYVYHLWGR